MSYPAIVPMRDCDERGVPLDWDRCRYCDGTGRVQSARAGTIGTTDVPCATCDGHGSLRARVRRAVVNGSAVRGPAHGGNAACLTDERTRCEDCGHPMSEGTWEGGHPNNRKPSWMREHDLYLRSLREGREPDPVFPVHYSPCDKGCKHLSCEQADDGTWLGRWKPTQEPDGRRLWEASWRAVDVRCLDWPHDLRPESLAILCLRCWAARA